MQRFQTMGHDTPHTHSTIKPMMAPHPTWLFATPLWQIRDLPMIQAALPRIAAAVERDLAAGVIDPRFNRSNFLGAQSKRDALRHCPYLELHEQQELIARIQRVTPLAPQFLITTWVNCSWGQAHNSAHLHPGGELSGVLYVQVPEGSGGIVFRDPRPQCEMSLLGPKLGNQGINLMPRYPVAPQAGTMLLFPSWLMHQVEPGTNAGALRIAISFNVLGLAEPADGQR